MSRFTKLIQDFNAPLDPVPDLRPTTIRYEGVVQRIEYNRDEEDGHREAILFMQDVDNPSAGYEQFTVRNPGKKLDALIGKRLTATTKHFFLGKEVFGERVTTRAILLDKNARKLIEHCPVPVEPEKKKGRGAFIELEE